MSFLGSSRLKAKQSYREHCETEIGIPVFSQPWWLDIVAGEGGWGVCLVERNSEIIASMPYVLERRYGFRIIGTPSLTPWLGPWIRPAERKIFESIARENEVMQELINQLPKHHSFQQFWEPSLTNWLSFYWSGFSSSLYCTYRLTSLRSRPIGLHDFRPNTRSKISKAINRYGIRLRENPTIEDFIDLNTQTYQRQGKKAPYSDELVRQLDAACVQRDARKILIAEDEAGNPHAGVYIVWDSQCAYLLMSGGNPHLRGSGATAFCVYEAVRFSQTIVDTFDFEGSMLENIEVFFRGFGAHQVPYISLTRTPSKVLRLIKVLREFASP
jgi:hypothetical protein